MFEQFSSGYYLGRFYVEPHDGDHAVMQRTDHEEVNRQLYASGDGIEPLDTPLVMKLDGPHFPVLGDENVPAGTLAVPESVVSATIPDRKEVLLATPDRAAEMLRYAGYEPPTVA